MHPGRRDAVPETGTPSPIAPPFDFSGDQGTVGKVTALPTRLYEKRRTYFTSLPPSAEVTAPPDRLWHTKESGIPKSSPPVPKSSPRAPSQCQRQAPPASAKVKHPQCQSQATPPKTHYAVQQYLLPYTHRAHTQTGHGRTHEAQHASAHMTSLCLLLVGGI